jgi:hypothetical protein
MQSRLVLFGFLFCGLIFCGLFVCEPAACSAVKPHTISFGKWTNVKWFTGPDEATVSELKVRPLYIDGRLREYVLNTPHDITERLFVIRRAFRINDNLPEERPVATWWIWQRGGWILVDRFAGHISTINFTGFDPYYSNGEWYRDYFAFCSLTEDGKKILAVVEELGRRKSVVKQPLGEFAGNGAADSACATPTWQRQPARVTFQSSSGQKFSFTLRGQVAGEIYPAQEDDRDDSK